MRFLLAACNLYLLSASLVASAWATPLHVRRAAAKKSTPRPVTILETPTARSAPDQRSSEKDDRQTPQRGQFEGGIKELIPAKFKERYERWKAEFLSAEIGRRQWDLYDRNKTLTLTISVSCDARHGAGTSSYKWGERGSLVAATITLGCRIDEGYPNPIYYPVMHSLSRRASSNTISGDILAAAKIAHEFGHVHEAAVADGALYRLQNQLIPAYNRILLNNGRDTADPRLIALARQMGGTPVEIWESREYWGEVNAMHYLRDRITNKVEYEALFAAIMQNVGLYAKNYTERFNQASR